MSLNTSPESLINKYKTLVENRINSMGIPTKLREDYSALLILWTVLQMATSSESGSDLMQSWLAPEVYEVKTKLDTISTTIANKNTNVNTSTLENGLSNLLVAVQDATNQLITIKNNIDNSKNNGNNIAAIKELTNSLVKENTFSRKLDDINDSIEHIINSATVYTKLDEILTLLITLNTSINNLRSPVAGNYSFLTLKYGDPNYTSNLKNTKSISKVYFIQIYNGTSDKRYCNVYDVNKFPNNNTTPLFNFHLGAGETFNVTDHFLGSNGYSIQNGLYILNNKENSILSLPDSSGLQYIIRYT